MTTQKDFFARTYGIGAKTGRVISIICVLIAVILLINKDPQATRYFIYAAFIFLMTRHYQWPMIIVGSDGVSILKNIFSKNYLLIPVTDLAQTTFADKKITFYPSGNRPVPVPRRSLKKKDWEPFVEAVKNLQSPSSPPVDTAPPTLSLWKKIPIPFLHERVFAFSLPINNQVLVIAQDESEELFFIQTSSLQIENVTDSTHAIRDYQIAQYKKNTERPLAKDEEQKITIQTKTFSILGLMGGKPILKNDRGEELQLFLHHGKNNHECHFLVLKNGEEIFKYSFQDLSGDWTHVTFSSNSKYILLGNPYEFSMFERIE
ncbi:MAG: hypothetical protein Q7N87_00155 [Candidatus Uhrbacteria bacterium]|nr:hypothetical protein [Candidatus Uhrbacteria bacterium]